MGGGSRPRWAWWVSAWYVVGFAEGAGAHAYFVVTGGLRAYDYAPGATQLLFHGLLVLDPLVVALVARGRAGGPLLAAVVMVADMLANWWVQWDAVLADPVAHLRPVGLSTITVFGVFVLATAFPLHRALVSSGQQHRRTPEAESDP
ncbi:hypothetical protein OHT20_06680 [Streptomyces caniferus]|uniref:Uncharacterized protein n=1 Tax=Streptomyces caniferus TaxID=285557 RepID=A0ABZ1VJF9_9ACTN|nr:hypothetical protein [Streptomyces caniferus]